MLLLRRGVSCCSYMPIILPYLHGALYLLRPNKCQEVSLGPTALCSCGHLGIPGVRINVTTYTSRCERWPRESPPIWEHWDKGMDEQFHHHKKGGHGYPSIPLLERGFVIPSLKQGHGWLITSHNIYPRPILNVRLVNLRQLIDTSGLFY